MQYAQTLAEIQKEKGYLELELMRAASKVLAEWQNRTGLAVGSIYITTEQVQELVGKSKSIVTNCNVNIEYEGY